MKEIEYREKYKRQFYSLIRNVKYLNDINTDKLNIYIENFKKNKNEYIDLLHHKTNYDGYYASTLYSLSRLIVKKEINHEEAIYILINVIDEDLNIYKSYEFNGTIKQIKEEIIETLGFFDEKLINLEKMYINKFKNIDEFDFSKKLELNI